MKSFCLLALVICSALATPPDVQQSIVLRQRRDIDIFSNTRQLIEQLLTNLRKAAVDALEAVQIFEEGLIEQAKLIRDKIAANIQNLRDQVSGAIQSVLDRISGTSAAVRDCVTAKRNDADSLLNETFTKTLECADERISEITVQIQNLKNNSKDAIEFANKAVVEMKKCLSTNPTNVLTVGMCLGSLALKTEMKGLTFVAQSGFSVARLNIALATVPAALEVCAGSHLVGAGMVTAKIVMEIGSCSASSVFNTLIGNTV